MNGFYDPFAQTRTSRGAVACEEAFFSPLSADAQNKAADSIRFVPLPPTCPRGHHETNDGTPGPKNARVKPSLPLLQLAICTSLSQAKTADGPLLTVHNVNSKSLLGFAREFGPLVARSPYAYQIKQGSSDSFKESAKCENRIEQLDPAAPFEEPILFWTSASLAANAAITMQEFAQEILPLAALPVKLPSLVKWRIENPENETSFLLFVIALPACQEYARWIGVPRLIRKEQNVQSIGYSFLLGNKNEDNDTLYLVHAVFDQEISAREYELLSKACELNAATSVSLKESLGVENAVQTHEKQPVPSGSTPSSLIHPEHSTYNLASLDLLGREEKANDSDLEHLAAMVKALISAHMRDTVVNPFSTDEETGYLSFHSTLSWLWFDFSKGLNIAKIRYCSHCGRPFPLVKHRGPDKLFCSTECKNAARNQRTSNRRDAIRREFREQKASVASLAAKHFPKEGIREGERRVRMYLSSWPTLKNDIDEDIAASGWQSPLLRRCEEEGLDTANLLTAKRKAELERFGKSR